MNLKKLITENFIARAIIRTYNHFDNVPTAIALENYRFYIISNVAFTLGWSLHAIWFIFFLSIGLQTIMWLQVVSILAYVIAIVINRRGKHNAAMILGMFEVLAHQGLAVRMLGWGAGFHYIIAAIALFPFLKQNCSWILKSFLVLACVVVYLFLEVNFKTAKPLIALEHRYLVVFNYSNIIMSFLFAGIWGFILTRAIEMTEAMVLTKNKELFAAEKAAEQAEMKRQLEVTELDNEIYRLRNVELKNSHDEIQQRNEIIEEERKRSEALLLNILPEQAAKELLQTGRAVSRKYDEATVMFTDFVGFTQVAEKMQPEELVEVIDVYFRKFDDITRKYGVEKIKTIGDAYMCVGGIAAIHATTPADVIRAALAMQQFAQGVPNGKFAMRIGIHTGSIVAGVVGKHKFQYDIWGDTVNTAARMEQNALPGTVNISYATYELVKDQIICEYRGKVEAKNKGAMDMYIVKREKDG